MSLQPIHAFSVNSTQDKRPVNIDDQFSFVSPGAPAISPDGQWIAYTVNHRDYEKNESPSRIWMIPFAGGEAVPMTAAGVSSYQPVFSKDGSKLYFLSARNEAKSQLWSLNLKFGGEAEQVTDFERGINTINFSSDEQKLLLVLQDEDDAEPLVEGSDPWVVDRVTFKADYTGYLDRRRRHVFIYEIATGDLVQLTSGDFDDYQPSWSPDDSQVAFVSNRNSELTINTDIWLVAAHAGAEPQKLTTNAGADWSPVWHPDGESLAFKAAREGIEPNYAIGHLARININQPQIEWLGQKLDRNANQFKFSADGKYIYFLLEDSGEKHIGRMGWDDGQFERLVSGKFVINNFALGANGELAGIISSSLQATELFMLQQGEPKLLTGLNASLMNELELGVTEEIHYKAPDGWDMEGFVTLPPDYRKGRQYPAILLIHGGPVGQYSHAFAFNAQLLAAQGYVVIRTNPRGSSGYGQDFTTGLYQGWGEKDYQDVLAGVQHVIELGYADPDRLGMGGYSYGGILTNYLLGKTHIFKAAVSGAGSGHYLASYGHDEYRHWYESELGLPWENRELWERLSPFNYIHLATTPTLFIAGEKDWNVPVQGSEQLYQVMKRVGIETQLVVYPGEHHGGWSYANERDAALRRMAWYARFLK